MPYNRFHPLPCIKTVVTTVTCSKRDKFILYWKKGPISVEKGNLFHVIHIILPILRQFRAFGAHQGFIKICNKTLRITTWVFAFSFISIALLYYYFLNSVYIFSDENFKGRTPTKVNFRIFSTVNFTYVNNYIKYHKIELRRNTTLIIAFMHAKYSVVKLKPEKRDLNRRQPLRCRFSALPTELWSQLGAGHFLMIKLKKVLFLCHWSFPRLWCSLLQIIS